MNRLKYTFVKHRPYAMLTVLFLLIFVIWGLGVWWGFSALDSLLVGILVFLVSSALYLLLHHRGAGEKHDVEALLIQSADDAVLGAAPEDREEVSLLRERLLNALERMKKGRGGKGRRQDLLYRLPWYLVIGQPAVGKSTLVYRSGLDFPFADRESARVAGVGGTRHCDWFFSSEAVLLDTAGRYVSDHEEVGKWRAFLELLQRHRPRRPLNGLIVVVSADELIGSDAAERDALARRLRERLQETHELLGMALPIYLVFTKSDLIPGFRQFHAQLDPAQRDEVLGMTFPHQDFATTDWKARFSGALSRLVARCRAIGEQRLIEGDVVRTREAPAALEFPLELQALSPLLSGFVGSLLQANPYQSSPLLRGFYFTSALADGQPAQGEYAGTIQRRFGLSGGRGLDAHQDGKSLFVTGLFSRVILPDQHLVGLYSGPNLVRRRQLRWCWAALSVAALLCAAWGVSFHNNARELDGIDERLVQAQEADAQRPDSYTHWETLDTLRDVSHNYADRHAQGVPWSLRFGLYRGRALEPALRETYFGRLEHDMLAPVADNLSQALFVLPTIPVYRPGDGGRLSVIEIDNVESHARPQDNSPQALADFGNATLGTYLELSRTPRERVDGEFLRQRLPDYWYPAIVAARRGERDSRDLGYASRQIDFYADQIHAADVPRIDDNAFLISSSRNYIESLQNRSFRTLETITLEADALFAFGRGDLAGLQGAGQHQLNRIAERLANTADIGRITVTGHADPIGSATANQRLSLERAETVRTYLIGRGMAPELIEAVGAGSERPLVECDSALGRDERIRCLAPNRRVEIEVRALN
ncbi:type VI secretion system membrane subunit TssM [Halomonas sp. MCCC 1A11036]|uniref:Type VI secretion system membrane subunit TssM n=1 Tax=Billgrantia zhangzhouensis TaxID=2733481 RepID=A0ABS9A9Q3_9GAMM|nr:type VI secretion system membrane subunit TssM [Halomonas zhangzhouensis]MCE8018505.1 type VI secretion system membrane subunit TssM [Halomonas zhangzhouensis]